MGEQKGRRQEGRKGIGEGEERKMETEEWKIRENL